MEIRRSKELFEQAKNFIPGGVNSPVRAFKSVGGNPVFMARGEGSRLFDVDGNEYIDYIGSWGPHIFGHNPPFIKKAVIDALENGSSFGAPTEMEVRMAELITSMVPSVEMVRMVNSGTEATMSAVRVARGFTGREKIIKFEGCYHGHADFFLIKAGSGALTLGEPNSPGVTKGTASDTLIARYNDLDNVKEIVKNNKNEVAALILEPVVGNMGVVIPTEDFINGLRELCSEEGIVFILDEVMTGFRLAAGGAQEVFGITPDLTTFGKIIGGGLPVGAFGGKKEIMEKLAPLGPVYQAGTLSGNPLAMAAGYAALSHIKENPGIYNLLEDRTDRLETGFRENLDKLGRSYRINRIGSMISMFFTESPVYDFDTAVKSDTALYAKFFHGMLDRGIYLPPAQFESWFLSTALSEEDIDRTVKAHFDTLNEII
ncbi:MAG: glutamate-1-semialdehyde 2,1-aminomutase [Ignavibacteria bacterium]|nr:glutamate-1-semialdehyde 2,1-aminomutase [Ignavibacteria bacterium]